MRTSGHRFAGLLLVFAGFVAPLAAQEKDKLPPPDRAPQLILAHPGPHAPVTALAFSPDGSSLYVGGFDKQVRRYEFAKGKWTANGSFRVPIALGGAGVVNAVAVSPDGKWVAAAGRAPIRGESWAGTDDGIDVDSRHLSPLMRGDSGVVYLFDPAKPDGGTVIRGPLAGVRAMAFANPKPESGHALVTASVEWDDKKNEYVGAVRVFNVADGKQLDSRTDLPASAIPPGIAAWAAGPNKTLRVAVAWQKPSDNEKGEFLLWDVGQEAKPVPDTIFNAPLTVRVGKGGAAELITAGLEVNGAQFAGRLAVRAADPVGNPKKIWLDAGAGTIHIPLAIAALAPKESGDATAVLSQVHPRPADAVGRPLRLELLDAEGKALGKPLPLAGDASQVPSMVASPDGRFLAVAGFSDNRVEVYDAAEFAAGKPVPVKLEGGAGGFSKVAFLKGEKLWVGRAEDTPTKGGVVLDLDRNARIAGPPAAKEAVDAPIGGDAAEIVKPAAGQPARQVSVTIAGAKKTITLPPGQRVTAVAFLPGKPAWDAALGPVVAVAHLDNQSKQALVTLFDPTPEIPRPLYQLGGPTLPVLSLAFSGTRPLLAAAGEDGTVAVWSLKNLTRPLPTIEGMLVTDRGGEVVVTAVRPDSPANGKLNVNDAIESVADAKGVQKPVKTALDFLLLVRSLKVGDDAQVKVKNKAAVAVKVGTAIGHRHPLFTLWVDPVAKNGKYDWVGWTNSGPYDANAATAEARIGWITATGDPTQPVAFAGANQYRKLFYRRDFIRRLVETADYNEALKLPPGQRPTVSLSIPGTTTLRDGRTVTREKIDALEVSLNDPDSVLDLDRAELRWQITGPGGESAWKRESLTANRAIIDLGKHDWKRGEHRVHAKLFESADAPESAALHSITVAVWFVPPSPVLSVQLDKKPVAPNAEAESDKDEVEVVAVVDAKRNPDDAAVTVSWTGGKPVLLRRNPKGTFDPVKVKLQPVGTTAILVTATNLGDGVVAEAESQPVELRVRKQALKKIVPPPALKLLVLTEYDHRTATDEPYVVSTQKAIVTASAEKDARLTAFQWRTGEVEWKDGMGVREAVEKAWKDGEEGWKDDEAGRKANTRTRDDLKLPVPAAPMAPDRALVVQVRAKVAGSEYATDTAVIRYDGLPDVSVAMPPAQVTTPELNLTGGLKVTGKRPFKVSVLVTSPRTGRTREFDPTPNPMLTGWESNVTLFPGENLLGYVVKYDNGRKEIRKAALVEIRYVRPPIVAGSSPVDVGTGSVGDVTLAVLSSPDSPPSELRVNGVRTEFRTHPRPVRLFGAGLWLLHARGVPVNSGANRLQPVPVVVWNAERESSPVPVKVNGRAAIKVPPPAIRLIYKEGSVTPDRPLAPVSEPKFTFDLKATSDTRFTRVELWHGVGADIGLKQIDTVKVSDAVAVPGGFELTARPTLTLHPGTRNYVRVVASNEGGTESFAFNVSYAPPPVRVAIDAITEAKPGGKRIALSPGSAGGLEVDSEAIEVEGRVVWTFDDEAVAQDRNLTVVFSANGVAHLPVPVPPAREGKERKFKGRVYLNALGNLDPKAPSVTRVRAELRSGNRPVPIPQAGLKEAEFRVTSLNPLRKQRLHVLMLGVEVPESQRKPLIRNVIYAVGGKIPGDNPNFTQGRFEHPRFSFAQLYTPQLTYTNAGHLNSLLNAARLDIEWRARQSGEDWVNDVIVVYYQGEDWVDKETGRWLLHSARSITPAPGQNPAQVAIRLDNLPQVPGLPVGVVNVASVAQPVGDLAVSLLCLRFAWEDGDSTGQLLTELGKAVRAERTVSKILVMLDEGISKSGKWKAKPGPLDAAPDGPFSDVARREIGVPKEKP